MTVHLMLLVGELKLPPTERVVLEYMCLVGNDEGTERYMSQERIAAERTISKRTVGAAMTRLERKGILIPVAYAKGGRGHATEYRIDLSAGERRTPWRGANVADVATFREEEPQLNVADVATFSNVKVATSAQNVETFAVKVATFALKVADSATHSMNKREDRREREEDTHARDLTEKDFDTASLLWDRIRQRIDAKDDKRHWLLDSVMCPHPAVEAWCLVAPTDYARDLIKMRWGSDIARRAEEISRRRLPVVMVTPREYEQLWPAEEEAPAPEAVREREEAEA